MRKFKSFIAGNLAAVLFFQAALAQAALETLKSAETPTLPAISVQLNIPNEKGTVPFNLEQSLILSPFPSEVMNRKKGLSPFHLDEKPVVYKQSPQAPASRNSLNAAKELSLKQNQSIKKEGFERSAFRWTKFWSGDKQEATTDPNASFQKSSTRRKFLSL